MSTSEPPVVDPRLPEDLARELQRRARTDVPEWRPPPGGDPGTALHQALALMAGHLVERVNRVPTHAFRTFLQTAGVQPLAPRPATAAVAFGLAPGSSATVVPAGTQVEASGEDPPVVLETDTDLTVLPVHLEVLEVWDPVSDRVTTTGAGGADGVAAFSGVDPVRHDLSLVTSALAATEPGSRVLVQVDLRTTLEDEEVDDLVQVLAVEHVDAAGAATPGATLASTRRDATTVRLLGTGTATGLVSALALRVGGTLPEHPFSRECTVESARVAVEVGPRAPAALVVDGAPVDPATSFPALGEVPHPGSELDLADPLLGVPGAAVTLRMSLDPGVSRNAVLVWEWFDGTSWRPFSTPVTDGTGSFTSSGSVTISSPGVPVAELRGSPGCWLRVRLASGGYGRPRAYVPVNAEDLKQGLKVEPGTGDLDAPRVLSLSVEAAVVDLAPTVVRRTGPYAVPALGEQLAAGLDDLGPRDGSSGQTLVLGLAGDPGNRPVNLHVGLVEAPEPARGRSTGGGRVPLRWEYLDGRGWQALTVVDGTDGLSRAGVVSFLAPAGWGATALAGHPGLRWLRVRPAEALAPSESPRLAGVTPNAVAVTAGETVAWEVLGQADGREDARFRLVGAPVLPGQEVLVAEPDPPSGSALVGDDGRAAVVERADAATGRVRPWVRWREVRTFALSLAGDRHYVLDHATGVVTFGDGVHGMAPPRAATVAATYRHGVGAAGNVRAEAVDRLRTGVPGISVVRGVQDADGGSDPGGAAEVERRGPAALRHRGRAVTATDVCAVAAEAAGGRLARCIVLRAERRGRVTLVVVPDAPADPAPSPVATLRAVVERELARTAVAAVTLGSGIRVTGPSYRRVTVTTEVVPTDPARAEAVKERVLAALGRFVHALTGGPAGTGWPLGRDVFESEVAQVLTAVPEVASVRSIRLSSAAAAQRLRLAAPVPAALGLAVGTTVTDATGRMVWTLDEPVPAGSRADALVVRGLTEADRLHVLSDVTVVDGRPSGGDAELRLRPAARVDARFPAGSPLVDADGLVVLRLTRPAHLSASAAELVVRAAPVDSLPVPSARLTLLHPAELRVVDVEPVASGTQLAVRLAGDVVDHVVPGAVLGLVAHPARSPVVTVEASPGGLRVTVPGWRPGDALGVGGPEAPRDAVVTQAAPLDDVVHVDPASLVWSGPHVVDLVAG